jgi:putative membrane protein
MKFLLPLAMAAAAVGACTTTGMGAAQSGGAAMAAAARTADAYVRMAASSDQYEIGSSQMVLGAAQNADVRRFAQMMIDHHTQTTQQLTTAAMAAGLTPPAAPDPSKAAMLSALQAAQGTARERLYVRQQLMAHQEALALHQGYASSGDNAQLRAVAGQAVPIIQQHLTEIRRINTAMGG